MDFILNLPNNPLINLSPPPFMNNDKMDQLFQEMIPTKSICNVNRSYSAIINKSTSINQVDQPPLTITFKLNPILIKGGGPNSTNLLFF